MRHTFWFLALSGCAGLLPDVTVPGTGAEVLRAPEGRALLVFARTAPSVFQGPLVTVADSEGRVVTSVPTGSFVPISVVPGPRDFVLFLSPRWVRPVRANLEAGRVYEVLIDAEVEAWVPRFEVHAVRGQALTRRSLEGLKPLVPFEVDRAQRVFHDTWDVASLIHDSAERYAGLTDDQKLDCTLEPGDGVETL